MNRQIVPFLALLLVPATAANAYIDPNSGGMLLQILGPLLVVIGAGWSWLRRGVDAAFAQLGRWLTRR